MDARAVDLAIFKKKSDPYLILDLDPLEYFKYLLWGNGCILWLEINNMQRSWSDLNVLWMPGLWI